MTRLPDHARITSVRVGIFALVVYVLFGGGRVVGSDEVTMLELSRAMLRGGIAVPEGATLAGNDGRFYTKNAAAQAVLSLPLVAAAEGVAAVAGLSPARQRLAVRFAASFFNAIVVALLLAVFYYATRSFGASPPAALAGSLLLGFTTPLWPYAKSYMAEPLQALGLLLTAVGSARAAGGRARGERLAAAGALIAVSAKLTMLPLVLACLTPLVGASPRRWLAPLGGVLLALLGHLVYNLARFGTPLETGYGAQASASAFTTPLLVGLYGLVLSSGKGILWFAPALWLAWIGWGEMANGPLSGAAVKGFRARVRRLFRRVTGGPAEPEPAVHVVRPWRLFPAIMLSSVVGLVMYARFQHWAGDGSFGPRYLIPLLPLLFIPVAFALQRMPFRRRVAAWVLAVLGLLVQIGGVGIYFGAQMREAGDYPYTLPLDHPRFMSDSHFNPAFSPIIGHWSMLSRNVAEHVRGDAPRLELTDEASSRLGIGAADQDRLLHAIDVWWLYLVYAGYPALPAFAVALALLALAVWAFLRMRRAMRVEARAP